MGIYPGIRRGSVLLSLGASSSNLIVEEGGPVETWNISKWYFQVQTSRLPQKCFVIVFAQIRNVHQYRLIRVQMSRGLIKKMYKFLWNVKYDVSSLECSHVHRDNNSCGIGCKTTKNTQISTSTRSQWGLNLDLSRARRSRNYSAIGLCTNLRAYHSNGIYTLYEKCSQIA